MNKFILLLIFMFSFVACEKEGNTEISENTHPQEGELGPLNSKPPLSCDPATITCSQEGMVYVITTKHPAKHDRSYVRDVDDFEYFILEYENNNKSQPYYKYSIDRELYTIRQVSNNSFEIKIKPFKENRDIVFTFDSYTRYHTTKVYCRTTE